MKYSHPKCYAGVLGDCSGQISKEHYLSRSIQKRLQKDGKIQVVNHNALKGSAEGFFDVGVEGMSAKILCEYHNSKLSELDKEAFQLYESINEFGDGHKNGKQVSLSGIKIERWILKLALGIHHSKAYNSTKGIKMHPKAVELLFEKSCFPEKWGLYVRGEKNNKKDFISSKFLTHLETKEVGIIEVRIGVVCMCLALVNPKDSGEFGFYRPKRIGFGKSSEEFSTIDFEWSGGNSGEGIFFSESDTDKHSSF